MIIWILEFICKNMVPWCLQTLTRDGLATEEVHREDRGRYGTRAWSLREMSRFLVFNEFLSMCYEK